jgi:hypothetical protein
MLWPPINRRLSAHIERPKLLQFFEYLFRSLLVAITSLMKEYLNEYSIIFSVYCHFCAKFGANHGHFPSHNNKIFPSLQPLVGFSGGVFLAFVFPPLIDFFTFFPILLANEHRQWFSLTRRLTMNCLFLFIGIFGSLIGLSSSLESIFASTK